MKNRSNRPARLQWILLALIVGSTLGVIAISLFVPDLAALNIGDSGDNPVWWFPIASALLFLIPGVVVLVRGSWHPVGWMLCLLGFGFPLSFGSDPGSVTDLTDAQRWWLWLTTVSLSAMFWSMFCGLILLFPDGLHDRRGGHLRLARAILVVNTICVALTAMVSHLAPAVDGGVRSPFPLAFVPPPISEMAAFMPNVLVFGAIVDFVVRYRRAAGIGRQQYRWVVAGFVFLSGSLVAAGTVSILGRNSNNPVWLVVVAGYMLVPISFMLAILRYRLYDIDRIISRTVSYGLVAIAVASIYAIPVILLPSIFGSGNDLIVAGSTLAAAAAFNPVRRPIQHLVERRFNRARFDGQAEISRFAEGLSEATEIDDLTDELGALLDRTLAPSTAGIWIRGPE